MAITVVKRVCLLLLLLAAGTCFVEASSKFLGSDVPYSIVYPVRVDEFGREHPDGLESIRSIPSSTNEQVPPHQRKEVNPILSKMQRADKKENRHKRQTIIETETNEDGFYKYDEESKIGEEEPNSNFIGRGNTLIHEKGDDVFIRIENADEDLFLQLRPNRHLRTQGTVIEWVLPGGATVLKTAPEDCYLVGHSVGEENSLVAVSSCSGLTGLIQTSRNSYFIEPLSSKKQETEDGPNARNGPLTNNFIQRYLNRSRNNDYERFLEENNFVESDENRAYQHQRNYQEILSLPEPHVIYKVNTILERLNISLHDDQKFQWDDMHKTVTNRQKRATNPGIFKTSREKGRATQKVYHTSERQNRKRRRKNSKKDKKPSTKKSSRTKKRRKRNRRHGRRIRELRQRCRALSDSQRNTGGLKATTGNTSNSAAISTSNTIDDSPVNTPDNTEDALLQQQCSQEQERRARRRRERENRKQRRENKLRAREEKKKAREKRKRERQQRRTNRKGRKSDDEHRSSPPALPLPFNLTASHWVGGYSPDLPWGVAQPGHTPDAVVEELPGGQYGVAGGRNRSTPRRWLEVTVAVDSSVIDFHGEHNTEQYIFTLFNIVSAIYQDPSLAANLDLVLLRLICYTDPLQSQVRAGEAKRSLEAVNRWASRLHHASQPPLRHDMAVWLTRHPLGGPSGYAPVGGVCHPSRSCTLNRDEGLTSAFIIAHEMGYVLGLSHDGDTGSNNVCVSEGILGSVMAPLVAATFTSFHWSRCSRAEYYNLVSSWECMSSPPSWVNATTVSSVVSYHYSLDDQCRMEFGEGFGLCRSFGLSDSCSHLWCANATTPHLCKTKKGPPLEGTVCGEGKWCRYGACTSRGSAHHPVDGGRVTGAPTKNSTSRLGSSPVRHNPQHGAWSAWVEWGPCSVTCGPGVSFRTRACDNPKPLWGGRRCAGKREEWRVCAGDHCSSPTDMRASHCAKLADIVHLDARRAALHWLPYEPKSKRHKCRVSCFSRATNEMFLGHETLRDGAPCSYDAPHHHICVQGKCVELGCDLVASSRLSEDECGVCGGDGETCSTHTDTYYDTPKQEYAIVTIIPKGARQISVQEEEATTNFLALADRRPSPHQTLDPRTANSVTPNYETTSNLNPRHRIPNLRDSHFPESFNFSKYDVSTNVMNFESVPYGEGLEEWLHYPISEEVILLNPASRQGPARSFVSEGAQFHYQQWGERESLTARGPLLYDVAILVHGGSVASAVHVTSSYSIEEPPDTHQWGAGPLGPCSTTCGGGQHRAALICRSDGTGAVVEQSLCSHLPAPLLPALPCNTFSCRVEWESGPWEYCSATCGSRGLQQRVVSCVAVHEPMVPIDPQYCPQQATPMDTRPCNRVSCPAYWVLDGWSECEGECGRAGSQRALWRCPQHNQTSVSYACGPPPPSDTRICTTHCLTAADGGESMVGGDRDSADEGPPRSDHLLHDRGDDQTTSEDITNGQLLDSDASDCSEDSEDGATNVEINKLNEESATGSERTRYRIFRTQYSSSHKHQYYVNNAPNLLPQQTARANCKHGKSRMNSTLNGNIVSFHNTNDNYERNHIDEENSVRRNGVTTSGRYSYLWSTLQPSTGTAGDLLQGGGPAGGCPEDASQLCQLAALRHYCKMPGYRKLCCQTCSLVPARGN